MTLEGRCCGSLLALAMALLPAIALAQATTPKSETFESVTRGLVHVPGFVDVWRDDARGRVLLGVHGFDQPLLMTSSLPWALGSNDIGLDRGQSSESRLVEFRRVGTRVMLVENNTRFRADSANADEALSVRQAFAESVLWAGDILAERSQGDAVVVFDAGTLLTTDLHGIARQLARTGQGVYVVDEKRSAALPATAKSFPANAELEALLTFKGAGEGNFVRDIAMDTQSLSLRQHLSLVRLPHAGYSSRDYHPASGGLSVAWLDFSRPLAASLERRVQPRFRLDRIDAAGHVRRPIVFYLDRGTPEPVRSALLDGANWWKSAFEKAGFKDAFRAELLPEGADPMDVRYNLITWAHRATRGWSYGQPIIDPRTGEIIRGNVTLGSQRVRQDILIAESLLAPYDKANAAQLRQEAEQMALARLRQLAAHEVGHALGFAHNFSASRHGNGSVMDYPHPLLAINPDGVLDLAQAYGVGVGAWDDFVVAHAYRVFAPQEESAGLDRLRKGIRAAGYGYISDQDARSAGDAEADGLLWDTGVDSLHTFDALMAARKQALAGFSLGVLPPERQHGELEARLVPIYLLHRYQTEAVARLLGGVHYRHGNAGEALAGSAPVAAATQRDALTRLLATLDAQALTLPAPLLDLLTPPGAEFARNREYFGTQMAPLFDPLSAAQAAAAQTTQFLFAPERLNRLAWQHARDATQPGIGFVLEATLAGTWQNASRNAAEAAVQDAVNWVVLDSLLQVLEGGRLHAQVEAQVRASLLTWQATLGKAKGNPDRMAAAQRIARYLADPASVRLRALPPIPPGAPI